MLPSHAVPNMNYLRVRDAKPSGDCRDVTAKGASIAQDTDHDNVCFGEFCQWVAFANKSGAMSDLVCSVLYARCPAKICGRVVGLVIIVMRNFMLARWTDSVERGANQKVDQSVAEYGWLSHTAGSHADREIGGRTSRVRLQNLSGLGPAALSTGDNRVRNRAYASEARHLIIWVFGWSPFLMRGHDVSHSMVTISTARV